MRGPVAAAAVLACAGTAAGQGVMIAPTKVFIDHASRSGSVLLYNPGSEPAEVTIGVTFGYPATDPAGNIFLKTADSTDTSAPSAAGWLQAFPRRLTVMPLERQTVRLLARPPAGLPDGEYWARLVISAKGGSLPIEGAPDTGRIQVGLTLEVRSLIGVYYRKGPATSGARLGDVRASLVADTLEVRAEIIRTGTSAFLGTARGELVDSTGRVRAAFTSPVAAYYAITPRFTTFAGILPPGPYRLRFTVAPGREDVDERYALRAAAVADTVEIRIP
jgi:hypothetical protein